MMKRYDLASGCYNGYRFDQSHMEEDNDGDYVLYSEAQAEIAEKDQEIEALKEEFFGMNNFIRDIKQLQIADVAEKDQTIEAQAREIERLKAENATLRTNQKKFTPCWCGGYHTAEDHIEWFKRGQSE